MRKVKVKKAFLTKTLFVFTFTYSFNLWAGVGGSLMQNANVREVGSFEAKAQADVILNQGGGFNMTAHGVTGLIPHLMDIDVSLGGGTTDFMAGFLVKYNILPDMDGQVGLSLNAGFKYIRDNNGPKSKVKVNHGLFTFGILTSKTLTYDEGSYVPYLSLQLESLYKDEESIAPISLQIGSKWSPSKYKPWSFWGEFGISLKDSLHSLNIGASYDFD